jgi:hypothetical protein
MGTCYPPGVSEISPRDRFAEALNRLDRYYLGGGLPEANIELGGHPYRLSRDGDITRLMPQYDEPVVRSEMTDDVALSLAVQIEEHLHERGVRSTD